jgi:hypothetical protein
MAEAALYGNLVEPQFPFEAAADAFKWIPAYIESVTPRRKRHRGQFFDFTALTNTLLVLVRARTSCMIIRESLDVCQEFVTRLNRALDSLPPHVGATYHRLELVPRRTTIVFITCQRSPRFIRARNLTHHEVGLNLDFGAPGHIFGDNIKNRSIVHVFEIHDSAHTQIMAENVYLDRLEDTCSLNNFYQKRTNLFNCSMIQLGLPYRFSHFWAPSHDNSEEFSCVMQALHPPSSAWWAQNYVYVDSSPYSMACTSASTQFKANWSVLRALYSSIRSYNFTLLQLPARECSEATVKMFDDLRTLFEATEVNYHDIQEGGESPAVVESHEAKLIAELESFDFFRPVSCADEYSLIIPSGIKHFLCTLHELARMWTVRRWQLRQPLVYRIDVGAEGWHDYGHERWCADPLRIKFRKIFSRSFWRDEIIIGPN